MTMNFKVDGDKEKEIVTDEELDEEYEEEVELEETSSSNSSGNDEKKKTQICFCILQHFFRGWRILA
jgi:hypothetical protein